MRRRERASLSGGDDGGVLRRAQRRVRIFWQSTSRSSTTIRSWRWRVPWAMGRGSGRGCSASCNPITCSPTVLAVRVRGVTRASRLLIGVGRVRYVAPAQEYEYVTTDLTRKLRAFLWELMIQHSIRPDFKDGFLLPYHAAIERAKTDENFDSAELVVFSPPDRSAEFSYASELVTHDAAIACLLACAENNMDHSAPGKARVFPRGRAAERMAAHDPPRQAAGEKARRGQFEFEAGAGPVRRGRNQARDRGCNRRPRRARGDR